MRIGNRFLSAIVFSVLTAAFVPSFAAAETNSSSRSFGFLDAGRRGLEKHRSAKGNILATFDEALGKDVLELNYTLPSRSSLRVWASGFPPLSDRVNAVRVGVRIPNSEQINQISARLEIKGIKNTQTISLKLKRGWNAFQETVDWAQIGELSRVDFVAASSSADALAKGTLSFSVDFVKASISKTAAVSAKTLPSAFGLLDAGTKGVFNIGPAKGNIVTTFDEAVQKDVWAFEYSIPKGSIIGVWTQNYPAELDSAAADAVRIGVKVPNAAQVHQVSVKVEVKGANNMQTIPLQLEPGWNSFRESINWNTIGPLKEVVFVVSPMAVGPMAVSPIGVSPMETGDLIGGALSFDLDFGKLTFLEKNFNFFKSGLVLLVSLIAGFLTFLASKLFGRAPRAPALPEPKTVSTAAQSFGRDFFYGAMAVFIMAVTLAVYSLGTKSALDIHFRFIAVGLIGAAIAELFKFRLTQKHLTAPEVFQNTLVSGLLAASSSRLELLQAPPSWGQTLTFSSLVAALTFLIYHVSNAYSLGLSGKHLKTVPTVMIVGTPYLFNWLLLVENASLLQILLNQISGGVLAAWPRVLSVSGRLAVVFLFNEATIQALSLATKGKWVTTGKAHWMTLFVSAGVTIAPEIADLGSTAVVASLPIFLSALAAILAVMLSYAGLWGEVYLITGMILDGMRHTAPSGETISKNVMTGMRKGMAYSGILLALLYALGMALAFPLAQAVMKAFPIAIGILAGAALFPLAKTIIETFDGSLPFFERARYSYRSRSLCARGAVAGFGFAYMITHNLFRWEMSSRIGFGFLIGLIASGGVSLLRDMTYGFKHQGRVQSWRLYLVDSLLGSFVGGALAFYLDASQVPVVIEKFKLYTSAGFTPVDYITYPLVNKWGRIDLGTYTGGAKLLFTESLAGVINWSIAAWLFAINKVFMQAYFDKETAPIKFFFSRAGFVELMNHMLYVLRWGLWMSPIIFTFLRMMPNPTWYNQDGAIRTLFASWNGLTMSGDAFQAWSLNVFVWVLAFDFFRVLIWMDHMGLRVATLVNLSFIGMDKLDEKIARFIGPASAQRYIPEAVKRFTTWGPLLIPFYLPRGEAWDYAWGTSQAIQAGKSGGLLSALQSLALPWLLLVIGAAVFLAAGISWGIRFLIRQSARRRDRAYELSNREYKVVLKETGECYSEVLSKEFFDVTRRAYDLIDPSGRILYLVDTSRSPAGGREAVESPTRFWPVAGNFPKDHFQPSRVSWENGLLQITNTNRGIKTAIDIRLPDAHATVEIWTITLENLTGKTRELKMIPYLEWVLNGWIHDRFHTQYARLYPEMEYASALNAILAWQKSTKSFGFLASDSAPEGFLTSRMDFIGRAQSIWSPRIFKTMNFSEPRDTAGYPTFDPIGSLLVDVRLDPKASKTIRLAIGCAKNKKTAVDWIEQYLKPVPSAAALPPQSKKKFPLIGHGEILPKTPQPYSEFRDRGNKLVVHTPYTPRPYDHALSNAVHSVMVTNRGLHTSCNGNSQQNRLTPDWADTVTREIPAEAIYLYDLDEDEWYSPTYHPLAKPSARHESEFSVDGTAVFRMTDGVIATELTVFVPPHDPTGVYLLTVKNNADHFRRMRIAPYFQMVLSFQPERSGVLGVRRDRRTGALFFENPRNIFRSGWAFASMSIPAECAETRRGRFFGTNRSVGRPFMVERGEPDLTQLADARQIAGFTGTLEIPAHGECTVAMILGQADHFKEALRLVQKYKSLETVRESLVNTRKWWLNLMETTRVETNHPEFDHLQNWLKYQALAERIWARRGFYQTSGAYGFRDQLQDTVNLIWIDPALARKQIILHASHQFVEGDVFHWFFTLTDGRTAFACRSHASDNPVWLSWAVAEYVRATGDDSILEEMASYVVSEFPFAPLPKNKQGWGHLYHRTTHADSIYRHCMKSLDLVLKKRMGKHGLPLMGTGDWNDGLDEIGSEGKGESVWLGLFVYTILKNLIGIVEKKEGARRKEYYLKRMKDLGAAIEQTWRGDRYLRAIHDDGTEIGVSGSGIWEIDALTAAWAVMAGIHFEHSVTVFNTALSVLEKDNAILLGWPALREDTKPYLGRSSKYPEGVRENGMYCHGVQWLVKAARILAEQFEGQGNQAKASEYRKIAYRLWLKVSAIAHVAPREIEIYGGQPNKQAADILTNFDPGRMIWHGYTGAAGWMLRQAFEGVIGASLVNNQMILPADLNQPRGDLRIRRVERDLSKSPIKSDIAFLRSSQSSLGRSQAKFKIVAPD